ncbi:MAG: transketolase [Actinobacteria bacterium]|jgi:transketolase|nr:transketolase [Actinomycetota bacterium]MBT5655578.1 transketolase [Actinomycetota bacterium]
MFDKVTTSLRILAAAGVEEAASGHPGMPLGMADVGTVLYKKFLKVSNENPSWINRDRFILSPGHGSMLLYSLLHLNGFDLTKEDLKNFRQFDSKTPGHPEFDLSTGIDMTTGPLGQGFSTGVGFAVAERYLSELLGEDIIDHFTYGIVSDGDLMEGISFEAAELAAVWKLGKLIYVFDNNNISIDGRVSKVSITDQKKKFEAIGWHVLEIDAHSEDEISTALEDAKLIIDKPSIIMAKSIIGKFAPNKQDTSGIHGSPLGAKEMEEFKKNLKWQGDLFEHDSDVYEYFAEKRDEDNHAHSDWEKIFQEKYKSDATFMQNWDLLISNEMSIDYNYENLTQATRIAGSNILNEIGKYTNNILGGSADLTASTKQIIGDSTFSASDFSGRNLEYGIREHAMGAIVNGITLHSHLIGYGSTFLVFSDYMRPSIRLAALMDIDSVYIFTHDSIYLGEDGPTHQPIEHLMALRLIPNLDVIRPSNSIEVEYAYRYAFTKSGNPKAIVLTRQNLEYLKFENDYKDFTNGASVVADGTEITIFASGSELELAFNVREYLKETSVRIVSTPILNKLEKAEPEAIENLKVSNLNFTIELGRSIGWETYLGDVTKAFSIDQFGISAPIKNLQENFNFTVEHIGDEIKKFLN